MRHEVAVRPTERPLRFAVIGAGMAGILAAIKLEEAGYEDVVIYEKADRLGGTWRENTYPGIGCDVPSHLYRYSFEPNPDWSLRYSPGDEVQAYLERVAAKYGVTPRIRFGEELVRLAFEQGRWQLELGSGHRDVADIVIAATGVLHHPNMPELEGAATFEGALFHSARWDHDVALDDARIGVVGTGSTAIQIVTASIDRVRKLSLFQRTAQWIMPQENPSYSAEEKRAFREHPERMQALHDEMSRSFSEGFSNAVIDAGSEELARIQELCLANLEESVSDGELRERLRPDYRAACKRLVLSPGFYQAIQQPNADLVTAGIERIEAQGVRTTDGLLHELDVLVLATGFRVDRFLRPAEVIGAGGIRLDDVWAKRPTAYLSLSVPGFPNLFLLNGPNGPVGNFSLIDVAERQFDYVLQLVERLRSGEAHAVCATEEATATLEAARVEAAKKTVWVTGCRSWYLDDRGVPSAWPWSFQRFRDEMAKPDFRAYEWQGMQ
jgi:cation diffusion facilitator CzcD-associated flavoprotein CzcO